MLVGYLVLAVLSTSCGNKLQVPTGLLLMELWIVRPQPEASESKPPKFLRRGHFGRVLNGNARVACLGGRLLSKFLFGEDCPWWLWRRRNWKRLGRQGLKF